MTLQFSRYCNLVPWAFSSTIFKMAVRREKTLETPAILKSGEDPGDEVARYRPLWMLRDYEILSLCLLALLPNI